ncbi:MAG TPA: PhoPQ-activated protein PqaA family protein [Gemmataceae bacterium]|jgi:PhoPQ-activated pathogenicity-related protein|nr:PhoPQ-activated protein PqaA family protein [Gemmataceae bacterium]
MNRLFGLAILMFAACPVHAGLDEYIKQPDDSFKWSVKDKTQAASGTMYTLEMVSQTWQGIKWDHQMVVYVPDGVKPGDTLFLWNDGGRPNPLNSFLAFELSKRGKIPVAFLYGIPKQPLFEGRKEDALIAETFVRFLKTEDESWPLLFPMAKSLVRAMDALQAFAKDEWKTEVKSFVVSGASKRGWTTWLTGAADKRVKAIAPCVIDMLNFGKQLPHQVLSFGKPSEMVHDYTDRGLIPIPDTPAAKKLWAMVDPWMYREKLTMPKLLVMGANDPYWPIDACNFYWDDLKGDKWVLYVPNAGHGLEQTYADGKKDRARVLGTISQYARCEIRNEPMPKLKWKHGDAGDKLTLTVECDPTPKAARLWVADATTRDFRKSKWTEQAVTLDGGTVKGEVEKPKEGWRTFFAECEYEKDGQTFFLSTQLRMNEAAKK